MYFNVGYNEICAKKIIFEENKYLRTVRKKQPSTSIITNFI